jgi:hypothetical protein
LRESQPPARRGCYAICVAWRVTDVVGAQRYLGRSRQSLPRQRVLRHRTEPCHAGGTRLCALVDARAPCRAT